MRVLKQVVIEFWLPFVVAVIWVWYSSENVSIARPIANFGAALFLASWALGHVNRIRRQQAVERAFENVEKHLSDLKNTMKEMLVIGSEILEVSKAVPNRVHEVQRLSALKEAAARQAAKADAALDEASRAIKVQRAPQMSFNERSRKRGMSPPPPA